MYWIAWHQFATKIGVRRGEHQRSLDAWETYARTCGCLYAYDGVAFVSDRPSKLSFDDHRRLHCEDGPAIEYTDGFAVHAWRGLRVPAWYIQESERITPQTIREEKNAELSRVQMEIYGYGRFLADVDARLISEDRETLKDPIRLYKFEIHGEPISILEMKNSSPEPDGSFRDYHLSVPPEMDDALEAMAWTWGMSADEYRPLVET